MFKLAASVFGDDSTGAAAKFQAFANQLAEKATTSQGQGPNCYKLFGMIDDLTEKANQFKEQANSFAKAASEFSHANEGELVGKFKQMAAKFRGASDKLKILAEAMAAAYANETGLNDKAVAFRAKVVQFHRYAERFEVAAQLVTEQADLGHIKTKFQNAPGNFAYIFGNTADGAAQKLHEAFNTFAQALTSATCNELQRAAQQFQQAAGQGNGFKHYADEFQRLANEIQTDSLNNNTEAKEALDKFKNAALKFGKKDDVNTVAGKLSAFAQELNTKAGQNNCYKLLMHANKFAKVATLFSTEAKAFKAAANAFKARAGAFNKSPGAWTFREAATRFYDAATYLKDFAVGLSNTLGDTELSEKANDFQSKVVAFYNDSRLFYYLAQQVTEDAGLTTISGKFQQATAAFSQAADQFGNDQDTTKVAKTFNEFNSALSEAASKSCTTLQGKTNAFKNAANGFQQQASLFKTDAATIEDITVEVTYLSSVTVAGQTVTTVKGGTAIIKPSRVQLAISQFKLSAAKFHTAAEDFQKAAETFGKQDSSAANLLKTFATTLSSESCPGTIKQNATDFKDKAAAFYTQATNFECAVDSFANEAQKFHELALQVQEGDDKNDLEKIQTQFNSAAQKFGGGESAAKKLYDAAEKFGQDDTNSAAKLLYEAVCKLVT